MSSASPGIGWTRCSGRSPPDANFKMSCAKCWRPMPNFWSWPASSARKKEEAPLKGPTPGRLWKYISQHLHLAAYFRSPGEGRSRPKIPAKDLLWSIVLGTLLRQGAFLAIEALVGSKARRNLGVSRAFGDDALGYFTQRLDPAPTRAACAAVLHRAKRNKAFEDCRFVGLALDGTTAGRRRKSGCSLCRPYRNADREILGYRHHLVLAAVVGGDLTLPVDIEPYGPGDSEYAAGQRLLRRLRVNLGARFIDYVVVDGEFATAPFLHACGEVGWPVVARLKDNLPALFQAAQRRFAQFAPGLAADLPGPHSGAALPPALLASGLAFGAHRHRFTPPSSTRSVRVCGHRFQLRS